MGIPGSTKRAGLLRLANQGRGDDRGRYPSLPRKLLRSEVHTPAGDRNRGVGRRDKWLGRERR